MRQSPLARQDVVALSVGKCVWECVCVCLHVYVRVYVLWSSAI